MKRLGVSPHLFFKIATSMPWSVTHRTVDNTYIRHGDVKELAIQGLELTDLSSVLGAELLQALWHLRSLVRIASTRTTIIPDAAKQRECRPILKCLKIFRKSWMEKNKFKIFR